MTERFVFWQQKSSVLLVFETYWEGDEQCKTSFIKGLKPGRVLCLCTCVRMCAGI